MNRRELYLENIEDVAVEISIDKKFREALKNIPYYQKVEISDKTAKHCLFLKEALRNNCIYYVEKVVSCPEEYDNDLVIFKFSSKEFPDIIRYTGNNL